ncbi:MAG: transglycosylase domain-containing protein, partial [Deltaproteobacteria bacterium]|nr:transglycosylase domain-containing protein [Deltaproteobacteria bacterium]
MKKVLYISAALLAALFVLYELSVPDIKRLKKENPKKTSMMEYREAGWKKTGKKRSVNQAWVPLSNISTYLIKAAIIAEDDKFYSHEGFDLTAIQEALEKNIKAGRFKSGGSTISQQLAKNLYLTPEKSALRKLREAVITWRLERVL